jgi:DNA-directed RNA polymerase subunit K/omega
MSGSEEEEENVPSSDEEEGGAGDDVVADEDGVEGDVDDGVEGDIDDGVEGDVDDDVQSLRSDDDEEKEVQASGLAPLASQLIQNLSSSDEEEELSEPEDEEEDFGIRIDSDFKMDYISKIHPEEVNDSFHEIDAYANIHRGDDMKINDESHTTYPILSKYEKTRVLGLRISQLNEGAKPLTSVKNHIIDNHIIAEKELDEKLLPFIIMRPLPNGKKEYWRLEDLEVLER